MWVSVKSHRNWEPNSPWAGVDLPGKESAQGLGPQLPHKRFGDDVQRKVPGVGEQPGPKVEEGAVGKGTAPP